MMTLQEQYLKMQKPGCKMRLNVDILPFFQYLIGPYVQNMLLSQILMLTNEENLRIVLKGQ